MSPDGAGRSGERRARGIVRIACAGRERWPLSLRSVGTFLHRQLRKPLSHPTRTASDTTASGRLDFGPLPPPLVTGHRAIMELIQGLRQHVRRLGRDRLFTAVCVGTLALGIGATTAIYAVVDAVLLEPLPYPAHDRLVVVWHAAPGVAEGNLPQSPALHYTYEDESRTLEALAMVANGRGSVTQLGTRRKCG